MELSERIAAIRKEMKLSQDKFGELVGKSQRTVAAWEAGARVPSFAVLINLSKALGVSVDYLVGKTNSKETKKEPAVDDGELLENIISRIQDLPDPALSRVSDFLSGLEAGQEIASAFPTENNPADGSAG